ncbi:MAG TPA: hypothetical protein HA230_01450 [Candidatus Aenigmarchaeota archaeon]|nr:hypothetical protein [Candidatus Aenigmarchaeota archaeon]
MPDENNAEIFYYQCMLCGHKLESNIVTEDCPKCNSTSSLAKISDWRFF